MAAEAAQHEVAHVSTIATCKQEKSFDNLPVSWAVCEWSALESAPGSLAYQGLLPVAPDL